MDMKIGLKIVCCVKNMLYIGNIFWFLIFVGVSVKVDKRLSMIKNGDMYFI